MAQNALFLKVRPRNWPLSVSPNTSYVIWQKFSSPKGNVAPKCNVSHSNCNCNNAYMRTWSIEGWILLSSTTITMDDLWGSLSANEPEATSPAPAVKELDKYSPASLVAVDLDKESVITSMLPSLSQLCVWGDELCTAAWELSNFVPPDLDKFPDRKKLWVDLLIPKVCAFLCCDAFSLCKACANYHWWHQHKKLDGEVLFRNIFPCNIHQWRCYSNSECSRYVSYWGSWHLHGGTGSKHAIAAARSSIAKRMNEIRTCKEQLKQCQSTAIDLFKNHMGEIFKIVGSNVVEFAQQESDCGFICCIAQYLLCIGEN